MHNMQPYVRDAILGIEALVDILKTRPKQVSPERMIEILDEIADGLANPDKTPEQGIVPEQNLRTSVEVWLKEHTHTEASMHFADLLMAEYPELAYVGLPGMVVLPDPDHVTEDMLDASRDLWRYFENNGQERPTMANVKKFLDMLMDTSGLPKWFLHGANETPSPYLTKTGRATLCYTLTVAGFQREKEKQDDDSQCRTPVSDGPEQG